MRFLESPAHVSYAAGPATAAATETLALGGTLQLIRSLAHYSPRFP